MASAETYVQELEQKNLNSFQRLLAAYGELLHKEDFSPADVLRLEMKATIEATEVAAMWLTESDDLAVKMALAKQCGDGARHFHLLSERLTALGVDLAIFDARFGGYSKLFAFFRSLQTTEERASGGLLTFGGLTVRRLELLAAHCEIKGDPETARLLRETLVADQQSHVDAGRRKLIETATGEESQARARRAAFRTIELMAEIYEPSLLRKFLSRSMKK
jgi:hypothetical protein